MKNITIRFTKEHIFLNPIILLISLYFFLSPLEFILNTLIPGGSSVKYLGALIIVTILLESLRRKLKINVEIFNIVLIFWLIFITLSYFWATTKDGWFFYYPMYLNMCIFFIVLTTLEYKPYQIKLFLDSYLLGILVLNIYFLLNMGYVNDEGIRYTLIISGQIYDPNNLAAFQAFGVIYSFYKLNTVSKWKYIYYCIFFLLLIGLFLTGSRGGIVTALISMIIAVFAVFKDNKKNTIISVFLIACITVFIAGNYLSEQLINRFINVGSYKGGSMRTFIWKRAFNHIIEKPLMGYGLGAISKYGITHNTYITLILEGGAIGFSIFMGYLISLTSKIIKRKDWFILAVLLCSLIPVFFLDALVKRFFWDGLILSGMLISSNSYSYKKN